MVVLPIVFGCVVYDCVSVDMIGIDDIGYVCDVRDIGACIGCIRGVGDVVGVRAVGTVGVCCITMCCFIIVTLGVVVVCDTDDGVDV